MKLLAGEVAFVAGGGRGFGRRIGLALAEHGASVCAVARTREQLTEATAQIRTQGTAVCGVVADLSRPQDIERAVATVRDELGAPTIVIFAAAVPGPFGPLWLTEPDSWWSAMTLHLRAPALLLRHLLPEMIERRTGHVVLVSSRAGNGVHPFLSPYCVGKAAQTRLAAVLDAETREFGVRVFALDPGLAFTQLARDTVSDSSARRYLPGMVQRLAALAAPEDDDPVLQACADRCIELVSGRYDTLGGRFLDSDVDLDQLLELEQNGRRPEP